METPILRAENLTHTYGISTPFEKTAVDNVTLDIYSESEIHTYVW